MAAQVDLPHSNFKEKVRCGEVYRNLNGNEMFQKFYYRCLECSLDFESSPEFEEHVIVHYLQEDEDNAIDTLNTNENIISISSDEEENSYLYAFEVASLVEENVSENDLPLPLMQMLSEQSGDNCDQKTKFSGSDEEDERNEIFPCEGLRKQALHQYSEHCCTQCPAYFNTKSDLTIHLHIHSLQNIEVCPHCFEAFANVIKLNEHYILQKKKKIRKNQSVDGKTSTENFQECKRAKNYIQGDSLQDQHNEKIENSKEEKDANHHVSNNAFLNIENDQVSTDSTHVNVKDNRKRNNDSSKTKLMLGET